MKMKYIKKAIRVIIFCMILFMCYQLVYNVVRRKDFLTIKSAFFSQNQDFDVLFYGNSRMQTSVLPMELWNNYGIISYNLANPAESMAVTYHNILLSLKYTNPKLIVIDASGCMYENKINRPEYRWLHSTLNHYPMSYTKFLAIKDLYPRKELLDKTFEYMFDFSIYHDRWKKLTKTDFSPEINNEKGADLLTQVAIPDQVGDFDSIKVYDEKETINMEYLRKIIALCNERKIELLLINSPYPAHNDHISISKYITNIADKYGIEHLNFFNMDIVDYNTDCSDANSHLNLSGARKITNYIGKYITQKYNIEDKRNNELFDFWYDDYNEYIDFKIKCLNNNKENLNNYLMMLYEENDIRYEIKISSRKEIKEGSTLYYLLENLNNNYQIDDEEFIEKNDKSIKITTWDSRNNNIIDTLWW